jgi:hypothetical protein
MIRALFFDFYSVCAPDTIGALLNEAKTLQPQVSAELEDIVNQYYHGVIDVSRLVAAFKLKLGRADISEASFLLRESEAMPVVIRDLRSLHGHFLKIGILGNMGTMELDYLKRFEATHALLEAIVSPLSLGSAQPLLSPEVFGAALQAIGEQPDSCVAISGHDEYLAFAASHGLLTIKFEKMTQLMGTLTELLDRDTPSFVTPS